MQGHRFLRAIAVLILVVALVYLVLTIAGAAWLGGRGLGAGWGTGWTGWLVLPLVGGAILAALSLLVFGLMLFFLSRIDDNLAQLQRQRKLDAERPKVAPAVTTAAEVASASTVVVPPAPEPIETPVIVAASEPLVAAIEADIPHLPEVEPLLIEMAAPEIEPPQVESPQAELPQVEAAWRDAKLPELETTSLEVGSSKAELPQVELPEIELPLVEAALPEVELSEVELPVVELPPVEISYREVELPPVELPQVAATLPEVGVPVVELPVVEWSETAATLPEIELARVELPDAELPQFETTLPEVDLTEIEVREVELPQVEMTWPQVAIPAVELPQVELPPMETPLPEVGSPELELPQVELPQMDLDVPSLTVGALVGETLVEGEVEGDTISLPESPAIEIEPPPAELTRPHVEITELAAEQPEMRDATAALSAATVLPEPEFPAYLAAAPSPLPEMPTTAEALPETPAAAQSENEVEALRDEVSSLRALLAQLQSQQGQQSATAPSTEPPAAVEPPVTLLDTAANKLPGADDVARIASEMAAITPKRSSSLSLDPSLTTPKPRPAQNSSAPGEDHLEIIMGVGPIYAKRLRENGITTYQQLAEASYEVLDKVSRGNLERVIKEDWRGQAKRLMDRT